MSLSQSGRSTAPPATGQLKISTALTREELKGAAEHLQFLQVRFFDRSNVGCRGTFVKMFFVCLFVLNFQTTTGTSMFRSMIGLVSVLSGFCVYCRITCENFARPFFFPSRCSTCVGVLIVQWRLFPQDGLRTMIKETREFCAIETRACDQQVQFCHALRNWTTRGIESGRVGEQWPILRQFCNTLTEVSVIILGCADVTFRFVWLSFFF